MKRSAKNKGAEAKMALLKHKADVDKSRNGGYSPLYVASEHGHTDAMKVLLDHKATVLEYRGETFAYLDTILDKEGSWVKNRNFFLWVPVY